MVLILVTYQHIMNYNTVQGEESVCNSGFFHQFQSISDVEVLAGQRTSFWHFYIEKEKNLYCRIKSRDVLHTGLNNKSGMFKCLCVKALCWLTVPNKCTHEKADLLDL